MVGERDDHDASTCSSASYTVGAVECDDLEAKGIEVDGFTVGGEPCFRQDDDSCLGLQGKVDRSVKVDKALYIEEHDADVVSRLR